MVADLNEEVLQMEVAINKANNETYIEINQFIIIRDKNLLFIIKHV